MIATLSSNHPDLSDWLLLIAFIVFVIAAVFQAFAAAVPARLHLIAIGLALLTLAFFVT